MARPLRTLEVGTQIGAHVVTRVAPFPEIQGEYAELAHPPTGSRHIHITAPDDNNMFSVLFPTVPTDSTGVAHILEHVALMGSERFAVNGTFYKMGPRSLNTFLNASTSPDTTQYYYTTRNEKDFYNLLDVYLDAAFFPRLEELIFKQEGHRLEFSTMDDPNSELIFKGVVFNEMKGQMSTPAYLAFRALCKAMFPDLTYANSSGGDPTFIPDLTWQQLRDFHAKHYHPSNSFFFTYGDLPLETTLDRIEQHVLSRFKQQPIDVSVPDQPRYDSPRRSEATYPLSKDESLSRKSQVLVSWLTCNVTDSLETLSLDVLSHVLLANASSPLRKALIDSGLGDALADGSGFADSFREAVFSAGLKGTDPDKADEIQRIIISTLEGSVKDGIDPSIIDAAIHRLEIGYKEVSNTGAPFSLKLFSRIRSRYIYGGEPYGALRIDQDLTALKAKLTQGSYLEDQIRRWLLDNPHRSTIVLRPDHELQAERESREQERLRDLRSKLTDADVAEIIRSSRLLKAQQDEEQDLSVLPTLALTDIKLDLEDVAHVVTEIKGSRLGLFPQPTNGLTHISIRSGFDDLSDEEVDLLPIYVYALIRSGAADMDYLELAKLIDSQTGGLGAGASARTAFDGQVLRNVTLSGKALVRNHRGLFKIVSDLINSPVFSAARLRDLIREQKAQRESSLLMSGHIYAMGLAASSLTAEGALDERLSGIAHLATLKQLAAAEDPELEKNLDAIRAIGTKVWSGSWESIITSTADAIDDAKSEMEAIAPSRDGLKRPQGKQTIPSPKNLARTTSAQVAYNSKAYLVARMGDQDAAALHVLTAHLRSRFLLRELRQKGGAYGAGATYDKDSGVLSFYTYRDPNIAESFAGFDRAVSWAAEVPATSEELKEAILTTYRSVDPLLSPDTKGRRRFYDDIAGYSQEVQLGYRQQLLSVTSEHLVDVARGLASKPTSMATIASADDVAKANDVMGSVFEVEAI